MSADLVRQISDQQGAVRGATDLAAAADPGTDHGEIVVRELVTALDALVEFEAGLSDLADSPSHRRSVEAVRLSGRLVGAFALLLLLPAALGAVSRWGMPVALLGGLASVLLVLGTVAPPGGPHRWQRVAALAALVAFAPACLLVLLPAARGTGLLLALLAPVAAVAAMASDVVELGRAVAADLSRAGATGRRAR